MPFEATREGVSVRALGRMEGMRREKEDRVGEKGLRIGKGFWSSFGTYQNTKGLWVEERVAGQP